MTRSFVVWFLTTLLIAAFVGHIIGDWFGSRIVKPYQERLIYAEAAPISDVLSATYGGLTQEDMFRIADEIYRDYQAEAVFYEFPFEHEGEKDIRSIEIRPSGVFIVVPLKDETKIEVGPIVGSWFVESLDDVFTFSVLFLAILLALYLHWRPTRRRLEMLVASPTDKEERNLSSTGILQGLEDSYHNLQRQVAELTEETEKRIENQRDFLHGVAHEFRGPLARLQFASELEDETAGPTINQIIGEMEELVTEILQYSRFHHGLFDPEYTTVAPFEIVSEAVSRLQPLPPGLKFTIDDRLAELPPVVIDEALYLRCLLNLLMNACHFGRRQIRIEGCITDNQFVLHVDDDGPGVPPGKKKLIFEPFTRLDPSRSRESGGAGLGLAIVSGIVSRLGGSVSVDDSPIGGARVTVRLPQQPV